jgi:catechol 2,3-dioxygenase-like lactoylglutathione lyase family enzyme
MGPTSASGKTNIEKGVKPLTIQQIATIEIPVTDIPRAVSWYEQILEMIVLHQSEEAAMLTFTHGEGPYFISSKQNTRNESTL